MFRLIIKNLNIFAIFGLKYFNYTINSTVYWFTVFQSLLFIDLEFSIVILDNLKRLLII